MADNSGGSSGAGPIAAVAIVVIVVLAIMAGGAMFLRGASLSPAHAVSGSVTTPAGTFTGNASGH